MLAPVRGQSTAQGQPITIIKGQGGSADQMANELDRALRRSHWLVVVASPTGNLQAQATTGSGFTTGTLTGANGRRLFSRKYSRGSIPLDMRQFADDIIMAVAQRRGIATSQIAFASSRSGRSEIYLCDYDGGNVRMVTKGGKNCGSPAISPNGRILAYVERAAPGRVVVLDLPTGMTKVLAEGVLNAELAFSPGGKSLAAALERAPGQWDIAVGDATKGSLTPILTSAAPERNPAWSSDGKEIYFDVLNPAGVPAVFAASSKGANIRPVPTGRPKAFRPDGAKAAPLLAFTSLEGAGRLEVWVLDLGTSQSRRVATGDDPSWGADGRHLLVVSNGGLRCVDAFTGRSEDILVANAGVTQASWTR